MLITRRHALLMGTSLLALPFASSAQSLPQQPMHVARDVPIRMDDGLDLRADVFRPVQAGRYPVIMTMGPYGKDLHWADYLPDSYRLMMAHHATELTGHGKSSGNHLNWETVDPERWVPDNYVVVRIDSRGSGKSPGVIDSFSPRESRDFSTAIE